VSAANGGSASTVISGTGIEFNCCPLGL
jgi:hypothetical protein